MTLSVGDRVPEATFFTMTDDGPGKVASADIFGGKTVALFAVPGAFTPTCNLNHLPGFVAHADDFRAKGCDDVVCVTVNDPFVVNAWGKASGANGKVRILADADGSFTKAAGMDFDASGAGLMTRSRRYAAVVEDGMIKTINIEDVPSNAEVSSADNLLKAL